MNKQQAYNSSLKGKFRAGTYQAKKRRLSWSISFDQYARLLTDAVCFYCEGPLERFGYSLDRKNSKKGYSVSNCVPCCRSCNEIKGRNLSWQEAKALIVCLKVLRRKLK